jgi:hypothetical protein
LVYTYIVQETYTNTDKYTCTYTYTYTYTYHTRIGSTSPCWWGWPSPSRPSTYM